MSTFNFIPKSHNNGQSLGSNKNAWTSEYIANSPNSPYAVLNRDSYKDISNYIQLTKQDYTSSCFEKESNSSALYIKEGTTYYFDDGTSYTWSNKTPISLPSSFSGGKDYAIFANQNGDLICDMDDITNPSTLDQEGGGVYKNRRIPLLSNSSWNYSVRWFV